MAAYPAVARSLAWSPGRPRRRLVRAGAAVLAAALIVAGAFVAGERHQGAPGKVTLVTGVAYSGSYQAAMQVNGYAYGVKGAGSVWWVDSQGTEHEGSWPTCLDGVGTTHRVTFGWVPVTLPDGGTMRQVVWVACRS